LQELYTRSGGLVWDDRLRECLTGSLAALCFILDEQDGHHPTVAVCVCGASADEPGDEATLSVTNSSACELARVDETDPYIFLMAKPRRSGAHAHAVSLRFASVVVASALPLVLSTCNGMSEPLVATTIVITPGTAVSLTAIGATQPFTAVVKDQNGNTLSTATVAWTTSSAAVVTITTTGIATAVANGTAQVIATSGSATTRVTVTVAQVAAQLIKVSGDSQTATVGQTLAQPLVVLVNDANGHAIAGATVAFTAAAGSGTVGSASTTTNASGQAQGTWTLGQTTGNQTASATVGVLTALSFHATAAAGAAASVAKQAGDGQTAGTGRSVAIPPAVIVKDAFNNPKPGALVTFAAIPGNGSVTGASQTTNASGIATVGSWTLGNLGTDTLSATVTGAGINGNPAVFTAMSVATTGPTDVVVDTGNNQMGLVGYPVNVRPAVRVTDVNNSPVSGATVTFAVASGGGSLTGGTTTTNSSGIAQVGSWTLGIAPARNTMTATVTGAGIAGNPVTFSDTSAAAVYTIQIQYYGPTPTATEQAAFNTAVTKWQSIIYQHVGPPVQVTDAGNQCGAGEPAVNQTVTDVLILAKFDSIDGPGKTLAEAGPCFIRVSNGLTLLGIMVFDTADVASLITSGQLNDVVLHEMNHVLGFGTLWNQAPNACLQLPSNPPGTIQDTYFSCAKGRAAFDSMGGTSYTGGGSSPPAGNKVPVENCGTSPYVSPTCGALTANGHWREVVFGNELMTGFINSGSNPLSVLSVAAEEDLGYTVNYAGADAYSHTFTAPPVGTAPPPLVLGDDIRHGPIYVVDPAGAVVRVINR
jgi:hypothetical protein